MLIKVLDQCRGLTFWNSMVGSALMNENRSLETRHLLRLKRTRMICHDCIDVRDPRSHKQRQPAAVAKADNAEAVESRKRKFADLSHEWLSPQIVNADIDVDQRIRVRVADGIVS